MIWETARAWVSTPAPAVAIDIAADGVSAVLAAASDAAPAAGRAALPAGVVTPAAAAVNVRDRTAATAAVRDALRQLPRRGPRVGLVVPDSAAKVSIVRFATPPERRADLDRLIRWKVRDAAPYSLEDAQVAWEQTAADADARAYVVVAMRRDIVEEYEAVAVDAGLQPGVVAPASFGLLNLVRTGNGAAAPAGDALLVHAAAGYNSAAIVRGGGVVLFRSQPGDRDADLADLVHGTAMYSEDRPGGAPIARVWVATEQSAIEAVTARVAACIDAPVAPLRAPVAAAAAAGLLLGAERRAA